MERFGTWHLKLKSWQHNVAISRLVELYAIEAFFLKSQKMTISKGVSWISWFSILKSSLNLKSINRTLFGAVRWKMLRFFSQRLEGKNVESNNFWKMKKKLRKKVKSKGGGGANPKGRGKGEFTNTFLSKLLFLKKWKENEKKIVIKCHLQTEGGGFINTFLSKKERLISEKNTGNTYWKCVCWKNIKPIHSRVDRA